MIAAVVGNGGCVSQGRGFKGLKQQIFSLFQTLGLVGSGIWGVSWLGLESLL